MPKSIAVIGECMLQLAQADAAAAQNSRSMAMGYGGDTLNTAIYMSRLGISTAYVSALGDDPLSGWLVDEWQGEGIDCSLVARVPGAVPGMYLIEVADDGERSFYYWRDSSPAKRIFDDVAVAKKVFSSISEQPYVYLSGISLAILTVESRTRLFDFLAEYSSKGGKIIYDGNYRPSLWGSIDEAQKAYLQMYRMTSIALPTLEDEAMLFGYSTPEQVVDAIKDCGVGEIVVKLGSEGCLAYSGSANNSLLNYVAATPTDPIDTTAAGDSFNAGYLAARLKDQSIINACKAGHSLASKVIQHRGAIIPIDKFV